MQNILYIKRGRRYVPVPDKLDDNSGFMVGCGLRYCLGRASYAPGVAMHWYRTHWHRLDDRARHVALRDVVRWLADRHLSNKDIAAAMDYRADWSAFAQELLARETPQFAGQVVRAALHSRELQEAPMAQPFLRWIQA